MKTFFLLMTVMTLGITSVYAQSEARTAGAQRTKDRLFPTYAQDVAKMKTTETPPPEMLITTPQALMDKLFPKASGAGGAAARTAAPANAQQTALPSSKSAEEVAKEHKAKQVEIQAKTPPPVTDQGQEPRKNPANTQKPQN